MLKVIVKMKVVALVVVKDNKISLYFKANGIIYSIAVYFINNISLSLKITL